MPTKKISRYIGSNVIFSHSKADDVENPGYSGNAWIYLADSFEILFFLKNDGLYTVDNKTYHIGDNNLIITHPGQRHILSHTPGINYDRYHIRVNPSALSVDFQALLPRDFCFVPAEKFPYILQLFETMDKYCRIFSGDTLTGALQSGVESIMFYLLSISNEKSNREDYLENKLLSRVMEYVEANIHEPINLDKLCADLFVSKSYLHHLFTETLKISPKKYITSKKLYYAQKEIRSGKAPTDVYSGYGFSNYSSFYRSYINHIGYPPSEETKRMGNLMNDFIV